MTPLRYYQSAAVDALFAGTANGNPLAVLATATGKSLVIAEFCRRAVSNWPDTRIIVATHIKELVAQNQNEFHRLCPEIPSGVYSAGLNQRTLHRPVTFVGIQSVFRKAYAIQRCDVLMIDEAHSIPATGQGMWRTFINDLKTINPDLRVIGLTATDYRMDTGPLTGEQDSLFTDVVYEYGILAALADKYICEVIPKPMATSYDISMVQKRGGEYLTAELERAVNIDAKTASAIEEIIVLGADRKSWLIFAAGVKHAEAIHMELQRKKIKGAVVTQDTPRAIRDDAVACIKNGSIRYIVNNKIFTTGFNAPNIDLIADLAPTGSPGLHVQKVGRGFRLHEGKSNCLLLDFARNTDRHGPLDQIKARKPGKGNGDTPVRVCAHCHCVCFAGCRTCPDCGRAFPESELDIKKTASTAPVISTQIEPEWHDVMSVNYAPHEKEGKTPSMKVSYYTMAGAFREWICFFHTGFAQEKAIKWAKARGDWWPAGLNEACERDWPVPSRIQVQKNGKYFDILAYEWGTRKEEKPSEDEYYEIPY